MAALSERLLALADLVTPGGIVADVGCDHGYLSVYLVRQGIARRAVAMDLRPGPLQRAAAHIAREGMETSVDVRLGDGLEALIVGEADTIVIAGMGGGVIIHILSEGLDVLSQGPQLILQPQSQIADVRRFLYEIGYVIIREEMVEEDGKFYPMMKAQRMCAQEGSKTMLTPQEEAFGPKLLQCRDRTLYRFLVRKRQKTEELIETIRQKVSESGSAGRRLSELEAERSLMESALRTYWEET